jgi:hypothetical protein
MRREPLDLALAFCIAGAALAIFMAAAALWLAISTKIEVGAMQKSTHQIQWVPVGPGGPSDQELTRQLAKQDDEAMERVRDVNTGFEGLM